MGLSPLPVKMHGKPTTHERGRVSWTGKAVDVQVSDVCEVKIPPLTAGSTDPLVRGRKSRLKTYRRCLKIHSQLDAKAGAAGC